MEQMDWSNLGFGYMKTDFNIRCTYKNGAWGDLEVHDSEYMTLHMAATALHYGQESFEGLKAFRGKDGKTRIFRMRDNALRMQDSSEGTVMAKVPVEKFEEAVVKAVKLNERFVPPYESGASLYIRPVLFGSGPANSTQTVITYLYQNGFQGFKFGLASAGAYVIAGIIILLSLIQMKFTKGGEI